MHPQHERGSVLLAVIWMLGIFAVFTVVVNRRASQELLFGRWVQEQVSTRILARSGVDRAFYEIRKDGSNLYDALNELWASHPDFEESPSASPATMILCDPAFPAVKTGGSGQSELGTGPSFEGEAYYGACDEASRINLNTADETLLTNLFRVLVPSLEDEEVTRLVQAFLDWRDADDDARLHGAEKSYYHTLPEPYDPRNGLLESVEELQMISGMTREIYDRLKPYVTVYTDGKVNFNTAPSPVLEVLGLPVDLGGKVLKYRRGTDGIVGSKDDGIFKTVEEITPTLSVNQTFSSAEFKFITDAISSGWIGVKSDVFRIQSIGRLIRNDQKIENYVTAVVRRDGDILYWREGIL